MNSFFRNTSFSIKSYSIPLIFSTMFAYNKYKNRNYLYLNSNLKKVELKDLNSLKEGEMKEIKYGKGDKESFLVLRYEGKIHALSNYCPHMGAPMHTGVLFDKLLKCPWHGASFDVITGGCEIGPSMDGLDKYEIIQENEKHYALIDLTTIKTGKTLLMAKRDPSNKNKYAIIGGGPAGIACAEALRQGGFTGEIVIYTDEPYLPYDRTSLSKWFPEMNKIVLRQEDMFKEYNIDVVCNKRIIALDNKEKLLKLNSGEIVVLYIYLFNRTMINYVLLQAAVPEHLI